MGGTMTVVPPMLFYQANITAELPPRHFYCGCGTAVLSLQYNMRQDDEPLTPMKLRERAGVTQRQVAANLDVTIGTVSSWERGHKVANLTLSEIQQLTALYQCTVKEFHEAFGLVQVKITLSELDAILQICGVSLEELTKEVTNN